MQRGAEKATLIIKKINATEEKPPVLGQDNRKRVLRSKLHPPEALSCEYPNLCKGRKA